MDPDSANFRKQQKQITQFLQSCQNLNEFSQNFISVSKSEINLQPGPRLNPNQIESKSGDTGDLFESGCLLQSSENLGNLQFTKSGSLLNQYCFHKSLTQDIENKLFEQVKLSSTCKFMNICDRNCQMKYNAAYSNVQKILLFQLHENQILALKKELERSQKQKIQFCDGQGCEFYFILNQNLDQKYYYCPLCLDSFELKI